MKLHLYDYRGYCWLLQYGNHSRAWLWGSTQEDDTNVEADHVYMTCILQDVHSYLMFRYVSSKKIICFFGVTPKKTFAMMAEQLLELKTIGVADYLSLWI